MIAALSLLSCAPEAPAPPPEPAPVVRPMVEQLPVVQLAVASERLSTPIPLASTPDLQRARDTLRKVVVDHARDPGNPWAIVHGMLALGPEMKLANDADPVDWMFEHFAEPATVGGVEVVTFPASKDGALVEPHTDLVLKALTESGFQPDRVVTVGGKPHPLSDLYRHSLWRAWVEPGRTGFQEGGYNDVPWALQALAAWSPPELAWQARGGRDMTLSTFTDLAVDKLLSETGEMSAAAARGELVQKDTRKGLFRYTCGGQHLLQGAGYAVARGFGVPEDRERLCAQLDLLRWRIDVELNALDPALATPGLDPAVSVVLLSQRLKFLGHWLETTHKFGALGLCALDADDRAASERVAAELVRTVDALGQLRVFDDVGAVRQMKALDGVRQGGANQVYLDLVGDSSHAVRGLDLATGEGTILR